MTETAAAVGRAPVDVWVGTSLGTLKGVCLPTQQSTSYLPSSLVLSDTSKRHQVTVMCWEHGSCDALYTGRKDGIVQKFSCSGRVFEEQCDLTGGAGQFVGLGSHDGVLITCTNTGCLSYWPRDSDKSERCVGEDVVTMVTSPTTPLQAATGGRENDLKVWDGNKLDQPIFTAKNVKNDKLDLRVPVWVNCLDYTSLPGPVVAVGTGHAQVRLYDTRAQRRPVYSSAYSEHAITALTTSGDDRYYYVANSVGEVGRVDLRKGSVVNRYRGFSGCVKTIEESCHGEVPLLAATGLDRYLRVYTVSPPKLLHQVYLKLQCNSLLFPHESALSCDRKCEEPDSLTTPVDESGESDNELWQEMETVQDTPTGKKRIRGKPFDSSGLKRRKLKTN